MRIGVLTGGGDCPGLNAVLRAVVRKGERVHGDEIVGFLDGWRGVIERRTEPLNVERCRGILPRGGTILGSSRTNPYAVDGGVDASNARACVDAGANVLVAGSAVFNHPDGPAAGGQAVLAAAGAEAPTG